MPLYMDVHYRVDGLTPAGVIDAHRRDLAVQHKYGVRWVNYWFEEETGKVFCLSDAPSAEAHEACHREAHGLLADEIHEVNEYGDSPASDAEPLCLDMHFRVEGLTPEQIADAIHFHREAGAKHGVRWLKAWYDPGAGRLFCLSASPSTEAHTAVHSEAGVLVDEISQVKQGS
ncbi:MAG TPA: nickel-binding protein [Candidatus Limnocylindria bacterium]|nr:nickel-binding protein [Candidatus Limnocylindria bacterium]